jgi:hypothetical protein
MISMRLEHFPLLRQYAEADLIELKKMGISNNNIYSPY